MGLKVSPFLAVVSELTALLLPVHRHAGKKDKISNKVSAPQAARFRQKSIHPFQAPSLDKCWRAPNGTSKKIKQGSNAETHRASIGNISAYPAFLFGVAHRDEDDITIGPLDRLRD